MKYLIINDENELYKNIFADLFKTKKYEIEEINRIQANKFVQLLARIYFSNKVNRYLKLPYKKMWERVYGIAKYEYKNEEKYRLIILNGTIKHYFSPSFLRNFKSGHNNIEMILLMYDNWESINNKKEFEEYIKIFDLVLSFDIDDCQKFGFQHIYSTFSMPDFVYRDEKIFTDVFFAGWVGGRFEILKEMARVFEKNKIKSKLFLVGAKSSQKEKIKGVTYNKLIPYKQELQFAYNTNCIMEILKEGQSGMTLRTCEAVMFRKKLITNNQSLRSMPFYNSEFMKIITGGREQIDCDFIREKVSNIDYGEIDYFSPVRIIEKINDSLGD